MWRQHATIDAWASTYLLFLIGIVLHIMPHWSGCFLSKPNYLSWPWKLKYSNFSAKLFYILLDNSVIISDQCVLLQRTIAIELVILHNWKLFTDLQSLIKEFFAIPTSTLHVLCKLNLLCNVASSWILSISRFMWMSKLTFMSWCYVLKKCKVTQKIWKFTPWADHFFWPVPTSVASEFQTH